MKKSVLKLNTMKSVIITLFLTLPFYIFAQKDCNFFNHRIVQIEETNINTSGSDMGPAFVKSELWFSTHSDKKIPKSSRKNSQDVFYQVYSAPINANGDIERGKNIELAGISEGRHAGPVSYCNATGELFVTLSNDDAPDVQNAIFKKAQIRLMIVITKQINGKWTVTGELPFNSSKYSVGHPAISSTGDTLYFASNLPGSTGGSTDLYFSVRNNGSWGKPVNLGNTINTSKNEMFPFVYHNGILIYASNGKKAGATDLDLYYSCPVDNGFTEPVAFNDFNSEADDFGLVLHENGKVGYFSSQRNGGEGDDDIYKALLEKGEFKLEIIVRDKETQQPIPFTKVSFSDGINLTTNQNGIVKRDLDYDTDYTATSEIKGYMDKTISFSTIDVDYGLIKKIIDTERLKIGKKYTVDNIYYDFDKWNLLSESKVVLDRLVRILKENPKLKAELGSHTDCRGSDAYNMKLSQKRSDSAVNYIISKGIPGERIIAKGYGETQLVNNCDDGVPCTEEQHQINRRTEFKILDNTN